MEVLGETAAHLSNYEVLDILRGIKSNKKQKSGNQLATITYQTIRYLEDTPCKVQTADKIRTFLKAVESFDLTKSEKLIVMNLRPKTALEIQLIVEDGEDRLSEEEVEELLRVVARHFDEEEEEREEREEESV